MLGIERHCPECCEQKEGEALVYHRCVASRILARELVCTACGLSQMDVEAAARGTIRKRFAENIERNCIHASDALETAEVELRYFFSSLDLM